MRILLIGFGAMGGGLLKGWKPFYDVTIVDPFKQDCAKSVEELPANYCPDVAIIAVKPQVLDKVLPAYAKFADTLFISIAAGVRLEHYTEWLGAQARVIRMMPNLPAMVGESASAYVLNKNCAHADEKTAIELFEKVGIVEKLNNQDQFDAVTALSGSGPAYVYYLCECLEQAAIELGLDSVFAKRFARQTIMGAAATLKELPDEAAQLRANVTSKGGTTQAALEVLMKDNQLQTLFSKALEAAKNRALELAKSL